MADPIKDEFNKYKTRPLGGETAGFTLTARGDLAIIRPTTMKVMNPQKMKARIEGKGIGGSFSKGDNGIRFEVMAGKQGGTDAQPWVRRHLKSILGISTFEVVTSGDADVDPDPDELLRKIRSERKTSTGISDEELGDGLSMLFGDESTSIPETSEAPPPPPPPLDLLAGLDMLSGMTDPPVDAELKKKSVAVIDVTQDAVNTIDNALSRFRGELMKSDDEELEAIADEFFGSGFPIIHGGHKVGLVTSMMNVRQSTTAPAYKKALGALNDKAAAYLKHLQSDPRIAVLDSKTDLPDNVDPIGISSILGGAISSLTTEVSRQLSAMD